MIHLAADPRLQATVLASTPLHYAAGADAVLDRPGHVRAGSGICRVGERLVVVQDDSAFLALIDPASGSVEAIPLPVDDGVRQWDEGRGNKRLKPDLEACVAVDEDTLLALGSGSTAARERILVARPREGWRATWVHCPALYAALRAATGFSGSEMNIEGAVLVEGVLRLFNRGNGAARHPLLPVDASCDLPLAGLLAHLEGGPPPLPTRVQPYRLGELNGGVLGFTDGAAARGGILFCAAAEASPDSYRDGPVAGSAVGYLDEEGGGWAPLLLPDGTLYPGKVEGIAPRGDGLWAVVDHDDPDRPAELCRVALAGPWPGG